MSILKKIGIRYQRTFKQLFLFSLMLIMQFCSGPSERHEIIDPAVVSADNIITKRNLSPLHKAFLARFLPEIHTANNKILLIRNNMLDLQDAVKDNDKFDDTNLQELNRVLKKYRIKPLTENPLPTSEKIEDTIQELLRRIDIIPVQLVMAQAIIESGWGNSDFAKYGNNYFGVHCYTEGCGVKPTGNDSADFYVKTYSSEMAGIEDYLWILNTGHAYRGLRQTRFELRDDNKPIDAIALAQGLSKYSIKGEEYVNMVSNIIRNYLPENTDELLAGKTK